jgi:hypothetical protein
MNGKTICLLASTVIFGLVAGVQSFPQNEASTAPLPFEILKIKWEKQARLPEGFDPTNGGASGSINDSATRGGGGSGGGGGGGSSSTTQGMQASAPSRVFFSYVYSMKIKNTGSKEIEGVAWDYVFLDPSTSAEIGRHQFLSFEKVASNKTATFQSEQRTPPVRTVRTQGADANKHDKPLEKSVVQCVLYEDGTTWRNESASPDICNLLKKGKSGLSHKRSTQN